MTSTTSFNPKKPLWSIWRWSLRSNRLAGWLFGVLTVVAFPALVWIQGSSESYALRHAEDAASLTAKNITDLLPHLVGVTTLIPVFLLVIISFSMFGYLFNKRQIDLFHALPVSRSQMLFGKYLAGLTMTVLPMIVSSIVVLLMQPLAKGMLFTYSFWSVLPYLLLSLLHIIMTFSLLCMIAVCCGTLVDYLLSMAGIFILFPWSIASFGSILADLLPGIPLKSMDFCVVTPGLGSVFAADYKTASLWIPAVLWLIMTALSLTAGYLCYKKRKSEVSEQGYAFRLPVTLTLFFGESALGILVGKILNTAIPKPPAWVLPLGCVAGALVAALLLELLLKRKERQIGKALLNFCVYLAAFGLIYGLSVTGGLGYTERVPELTEIKSVSIESQQQDYGYIQEFMMKLLGETTDNMAVPELETEENRKLALRIQEMAVKDRKASAYPYRNAPGTFVNKVKLTYRLTNGKTMTRVFEYRNEEIDDTVYQSWGSAEYKRKTSVVFTTKPEDLLFIAMNGTAKMSYYPLTVQQCQTLYTALKTDLLSSSESEQNLSGYYMYKDDGSNLISLGYASEGVVINRESVTKEKLEDMNIWSKYQMQELSIPSSYENTMRLLISWGVTEGRFSLDTVPVSQITAVYTQSIRKMTEQERKEYYQFDTSKQVRYVLGTNERTTGMRDITDPETLLQMYVTERTSHTYEMQRSRDNDVMEGLYRISKENENQAEAFRKKEEGYIYYFESKDAKGNTVYSRPFFGNKEEVKKILGE